MVYAARGIEAVLDKTGVREKVCEAFIRTFPIPIRIPLTEPKVSSIGGWIYFQQGTGRVIEFRPSFTVHMPEDNPLQSPDEVYRLAREYGGNRFLRISLQRKYFRKVDLESVETIFDQSFYNWEKIISDGTGRAYQDMNERTYDLRDLFVRLFDIFKIEYRIDEERKVIQTRPNQVGMHITAEGVKKAYELMLETGYSPSIASGGALYGFHLFQYPSNRNFGVPANIHLYVQGDNPREYTRDKHEIPHGALELVTSTIERYGFSFPNSLWKFEGSRIEQVKNSKHRDKLKGREPDEWIYEQGYQRRFVA